MLNFIYLIFNLPQVHFREATTCLATVLGADLNQRGLKGPEEDAKARQQRQQRQQRAQRAQRTRPLNAAGAAAGAAGGAGGAGAAGVRRSNNHNPRAAGAAAAAAAVAKKAAKTIPRQCVFYAAAALRNLALVPGMAMALGLEVLPTYVNRLFRGVNRLFG